MSGTERASRVGCVFAIGLVFLLVACTAPQRTVARADPDPGGYHGGTSVPEPYELPATSLRNLRRLGLVVMGILLRFLRDRSSAPRVLNHADNLLPSVKIEPIHNGRHLQKYVC